MTDLQTSLIAIGSAIVVGVISYNKWQEHIAKKTLERAFSPDQEDVLMHVTGTEPNPQSIPLTDRKEPGFGPDPVVTTQISEAVDEPLTDIAPLSSPLPVRDLPVDELVDCAIALAVDQPLRGDKIIGPIQQLRHVGNKPVNFIGLRDGSYWEAVVHGGNYTALQAGVQLANRTSALNEIEYSELISRLRAVADDIGAEPDVPDMTTVMRSARALHQFITEFDAQLSVNVQSNGAPWAIHTLLIALEKQGFDLRPEGRLVMPDGDGGILFSLSTNVTLAADTTSRLTLLLDVPCVARQHNGFGAMVACARSLALRMSGTVVDDGNEPLTEQALANIAQQVKDFYASMEAADIPAGSARALRLFS
jgi:hypothetical protein